MYDVIAIGELLVDMSPVAADGTTCFRPNAGGAPCNFLVAAGRMGARTAFVGKVGDDAFGRMLRDTARDAGVDTAALVMDPSVPTTLAFVHLDGRGDRSFSFYRRGCSDVSLRPDEVDPGILDRARALYFGSLAFTDEPLRSTAALMLREARARGLLVCYDPNYRPALWPSEEAAVAAMKEGLRYADALKVSDGEATLITGLSDPREAAAALERRGIALVCVTLGERGAVAACRGEVMELAAPPVRAVDTTGAGDAFFGTLMAQVLLSGRPIDALGSGEVREMVRIAVVAASLSVQKAGAIPAMPTRAEILAAAGPR